MWKYDDISRMLNIRIVCFNSKKSNATWNFFTELFYKTCQHSLNARVQNKTLSIFSFFHYFAKMPPLDKSK